MELKLNMALILYLKPGCHNQVRFRVQHAYVYTPQNDIGVVKVFSHLTA
jgi:hypothetical protein